MKMKYKKYTAKDNISLKDVLSLEEYKKVSEENIDVVIGALKHEGYVDDGKLRELLHKIHNGELTYKEARKIILKHESSTKSKLARDAEILAGLDNCADLSKEFIKNRNKWIKGEISDEQYKAFVLKTKEK